MATQTISPGASWDTAYRTATPGDIIEVQAGAYPAQNIEWMNGRDSAAPIKFVPLGTVTINGNLTISASGVYVAGTVTGSLSDWRNRSYSVVCNAVSVVGIWSTQYPHNVTLEGIDTKNLDCASSLNLTIRDVDVGPAMVDGACDRFENRIGGNGAAVPVVATNLLWERVIIHDQNRTQVAANNGCHYGGVIWPNGNKITIRESIFERNVVYHLSAGNYSRTDGPRDVLIENCAFGAPVENSYYPNGVNVPNGQHAIQLDAPGNPSGDPYSATWTVRNCKFATGGKMIGCYADPCSPFGVQTSGNTDGPANATAPPLSGTPPPDPPPDPDPPYDMNAEYTKLEGTSTHERWRKANPNEATKVEAYWRSAGTKPSVATPYGQFLLDAAEEIRR